jgi:hypothetical protein
MHNTAPKAAASLRKSVLEQAAMGVHWSVAMPVRERGKLAAHWALTYADAKPSLALVGRVWGVSPGTVLKALKELNGNGHNGHTPAPVVDLDSVVGWWLRATDAERAALVKAIGVGSAWRAIEANIG